MNRCTNNVNPSGKMTLDFFMFPNTQHELTTTTAVAKNKQQLLNKSKPSKEHTVVAFEKKVNNKQQSNEEYFQHLAEEILSKILQIEPKLGRTLTIHDLSRFSKAELGLVWDAILVYYPDIYSTEIPEDQEVEAVG